ncbi:MAG TPA: hypothetical protein VGP48_13000 [Stellaceae bacterium]|jgi:hypothetical protein|nr:hypothetical protein [Stellaceae bacterium]
MMLRRFKTGFWGAFAASAAGLLVPAVMWARLVTPELPPKPAFPVPGREFVAEYGGQAAYIAHIAYWWGLFGIGTRLRDADVLLLGSSHVQLGLSARQMSDALSQASGRPVRVFNAGLGCDTPLAYDAALLDHLGLRDRVVVVDAFANDYDPYNAPCFAELAGITDRVHAGFKALAVWSRFDWDWLLDGILPRIDLRDGRIAADRYLNAPATILDWNDGDAVELFHPARGEEFPHPVSAPLDLASQQPPRRLAAGTMPLPAPFMPAMTRGLRPVFTLIPFSLTPPFDRTRYENVADLLAASGSPRAPFVALAPDGLASFDGEHLTGESRAAATARLAAALAEANLLQAVSPP